ncbi:Crp/Fnr family transcriptional regulator [Bacillus timonensis]|nr:Crp/Fnr family transcriptional regulator [Bacillus timonensis]
MEIKRFKTTNDTDFLTEDLKKLFSSSNHIEKVKKDNYLFQEGMESSQMYLIKSGLIQVSKLTSDGKELTLRVCTENDIVGELSIFSEEAKYMLNAKALEDSEVIIIQKAFLEQELLKNGPLAVEFMKWLSNHLRKTQTKFRDLVLNGKKGALYSTLIRMTNSYGVKQEDGILIDMALTNQDLANFCGTSRESVNRMLSELKKQNVITTINGKMHIIDLQFLKDEISCEECPTYLCSID